MVQISSVLVGVGIGALVMSGFVVAFNTIPRMSQNSTLTETTTSTYYSTVTSTSVAFSVITTTMTTGQAMSYPSFTTALMTTSYHLLFQLDLSNSTLFHGENITIHLRLTNLLSNSITVPVASTYAIPGLGWPGLPGCYETYWANPLGIAIFRGTLTDATVSNATMLYLWRPGTYAGCPGSVVDVWQFRPLSDVASYVRLDANFTTNGYWTAGDVQGNGSTFVQFSPGTYTVTAGDEWGDLLLLYFRVG